MPTILLVDDEPNALNALERTLRDDGRVLLKTTDAKQGLEILRQEPVDLLICDQHMPGMSGAELLQEAKTISPEAMRVMLTGNVNIDNAIAAINLGEVSYFVSKPWSPRELRTVVENALARAQLVKENERLTECIHQQNDELRVWSHRLETRVAERTQELADTNGELAEQNEKLTRAQATLIHDKHMAAIGRLAAGVAHEMNNPLTGILGYAQLLLAGEEDDEKRHQLSRIMEEGDRCQHIVENLLRFARERPPSTSMANLPEAIGDCLDLMSYELRQADIEVTTNCATDVPLIRVDVGQLQQVFLNIIENACLSLAEVERERRIDIEIDRPVEDTVQIRIADNGVGVPPENTDRVFTPFFTTRQVGEGTGLGLTVAYGIVREHGGSIHAEHNEPAGARIVIILPVSDEPVLAPAVEEDGPAAPTV